jgi:transmembrane sensor
MSDAPWRCWQNAWGGEHEALGGGALAGVGNGTMNSHSPLPGATDDRLEQAGEWQARLHDAPSDAALRAGLDDWLRRDLRNRLAYAEICAAAFALEQAGEAPDVRATARAAGPRRGVWPGLAASLVVLFFAWQGLRPLDALRSDVRTAEGEVREVALPDGSRAWLAGDTALALEFDGAGRELVLLRGEALFEVRPDASRPFVVHAGDTAATAVGTRYAVTRVRGDVLVQVEEGKVAVAAGQAPAVRVEAGRQIRAIAGHVPAVTAPLEAGALEWRRGLLVFEDTPLADAVARLDAYIPGRVVLLGQSQARISAAIALADAPAALAALAAREGLAVEAIPGVVMVVH